MSVSRPRVLPRPLRLSLDGSLRRSRRSSTCRSDVDRAVCRSHRLRVVTMPLVIVRFVRPVSDRQRPVLRAIGLEHDVRARARSAWALFGPRGWLLGDLAYDPLDCHPSQKDDSAALERGHAALDALLAAREGS